MSDAEQFRTVRDAMKVIEIGESEQKEIFAIVASVLHLGNIKFVQNDKGFAEILLHDANTGNVAEVSTNYDTQEWKEILKYESIFFFKSFVMLIIICLLKEESLCSNERVVNNWYKEDVASWYSLKH